MKKIIITILNLFNIPANEHNLTLSNVYSYLQSKIRGIQMNSEFIKIISRFNLMEYLGLPLHKKEQIIWRICFLEDHPQGKQCLKNNECPCECVTSDVIISDASCDQNCFPDMMSKEEWDIFKTENNFSVDLINNKIIKYVN